MKWRDAHLKIIFKKNPTTHHRHDLTLGIETRIIYHVPIIKTYIRIWMHFLRHWMHWEAGCHVTATATFSDYTYFRKIFITLFSHHRSPPEDPPPVFIQDIYCIIQSSSESARGSTSSGVGGLFFSSSSFSLFHLCIWYAMARFSSSPSHSSLKHK